MIEGIEVKVDISLGLDTRENLPQRKHKGQSFVKIAIEM